ncbi:MAG: VWA domain-containing protein [Proteobacteria bacterium]|jgi:Ca-activated chloride channel homolog|nr:VWA domain-containing protein [Pseudomonadota bacterium]
MCVLLAAFLAVAQAATYDEAYAAPGQFVTDKGGLVLTHTSVEAVVQVGLAVVDVRQTFENPFDSPVDATYVFPLPTDASVRHMEMTCGERTIEAEIKQKDEALRIFDRARSDGRQASLLEQQMPNIFTQHVGGICPGETVQILFEYVEQLKLEKGNYELVFPTTVGPRHGVLEQGPTAELELPPLEFRSGRDVDISVIIDEGMAIESLWSDTHDISIAEEVVSAEVTLDLGDTLPNKDFQLAWMLAGKTPRAAAVTYDNYLAVSLEPQILKDLASQQKRELLFVLDSSGSMSGQPWDTAVSAVELALEEMVTYDTFNLVRFSDQASSLFAEPQAGTRDNIAAAQTWLGNPGGGGTNMVDGIVHSLDMPGDPKALRLVLLLTDGYIGNEEVIFDAVSDHLGEARMFSLGVGSSVNRYLLDGLAEMGRGTVAYQLPETPLSETIDKFYSRIAHPAMTNIEVDFGELEVDDQYPSRIPDLFSGQPLRSQWHRHCQLSLPLQPW